jgi:hypothetical protein
MKDNKLQTKYDAVRKEEEQQQKILLITFVH